MNKQPLASGEAHDNDSEPRHRCVEDVLAWLIAIAMAFAIIGIGFWSRFG